MAYKRRNKEYYLKPLWRSMIRRCDSPMSKDYTRYGGRGITVCDRWYSYDMFYKDMGDRPNENYSLERIDNDKGYSPDNCVWADRVTQANNRRSNRMITLDGVTMNLTAWAKKTGLSRTVITQRLDSYGWSVRETLTTSIIRRT